ncbi:MAG: TIGR04282 family arsenosugar biosynthesis glycosyltransferase [Bacteroidetes bacterium]|nr:TIGR04282 family arsenosugar biosynthesis glycosyltransferase [Bacteroidota bacterium]
MKEAIIVFAKNPVKGNVKTRLAADIGIDKAHDIYVKLLKHTHDITKDLECGKFLYLTERKDEQLFDGNYRQELQNGPDLGERMKRAFDEVFKKGFRKILIIGTDCPGLNPEIINTAFEKLNENDFVLGPTDDGGYYLLGMKKTSAYLFEDIVWSTEEVLSETVKRIEKNKKSHFLLNKLKDIDDLEDLQKTGFV